MVDDRDSMKMPVTPTQSAHTGTAPKREMPTIRCGSCGFSVTGWDEDVNLEAYEEHVCPKMPRGWAQSFFENVFSLWGVIIVFLIVAGIVRATGHGNF